MLGGLLKTGLKLGVLAAAAGAVLGVIGHYENNKNKDTEDSNNSVDPVKGTEDLTNEAVINTDAVEAEDGAKVFESISEIDADSKKDTGDTNEAA